MYLRTWSSVKPYLAFSHTQKAVTEASASRIGWPFRSAIVSTPGVGVGDQHLRVLLEDRRHRLHAARFSWARFMTMKLLEPMPRSDRAGGQQLRHVHAGPALDDGHVEAALGVLAVGQRLVEAAVLGLGAPVGGEADGGAAGCAPRPSSPASRRPAARRRRRRAQLAMAAYFLVVYFVEFLCSMSSTACQGGVIHSPRYLVDRCAASTAAW